jgi:DNA-binding CsgD family transcriptional regulator
MARRACASAAPGDRNTRLIAKVVLAFSLLLIGRGHEGVPELREAAGLVREAGSEELDVEYVLFAALGSAWYGDGSAHALLDPLLHDLRANGALGHLPFALYVSALADSRLGRLDRGRATAAEAADMAGDTGNLLWRMLSLGCLALLEAQRGDEQACRAAASESLRLRERADLFGGRDALDALGMLELSLGRPDRAIGYFERVNRHPAPGTDQQVVGRASAIDLIEAYARTETPPPTSMVEQLHRFTELEFPAGLAALLWRGRALLAGEQQFDDCFARALELQARSPSTFDTARTLLCYGERLRRAGRRRDARQHLEAALETFQRIGARLWSQRAAAELRAAGQLPATTGGGDSREALTVQELQVARFAGSGATNREIAAQLFLSVKTIEMHLGRVYRKLGVRSRTQLANVLRTDEVA